MFLFTRLYDDFYARNNQYVLTTIDFRFKVQLVVMVKSIYFIAVPIYLYVQIVLHRQGCQCQ